jgi:hypothetical protein
MNVLGLVSSLKEEKSCKVVILLNQDALSGASKDIFEAQLEKVADTIMTFEPTPTEAAEIGIDKTTKFHPWLSEDTQALGIVNIRTIKKIETFCRRVQDFLVDHDPRILKQSVHTLALAAYAKFQPDDAPSLEYIKAYNKVTGLIGRQKDTVEDPNSRYNNLLQSYGFQHLDEFDSVLVEGVERGFFDEAGVKCQADELQKKLEFGDKTVAFEKAWRLFHDSFDDNQDAVLDEMINSVKENVMVISPIMLSGTVAFLKEFEHEEEAKELVRFYMDHCQEAPDFWNLHRHPFLTRVTDPDVRDAFEKKFTIDATPLDPAEILKRIGGQSGWGQEDLERLAGLCQDEYVNIFKRLRDSDLGRAVRGGLLFRDLLNADERMKSIGQMVVSALRQIARESPMNSKRVRNFGVNVEETDSVTDVSAPNNQDSQ